MSPHQSLSLKMSKKHLCVLILVGLSGGSSWWPGPSAAGPAKAVHLAEAQAWASLGSVTSRVELRLHSESFCLGTMHTVPPVAFVFVSVLIVTRNFIKTTGNLTSFFRSRTGEC